ncbi:hypothetical protein [Pseudooceanicola sp. MF1-13]|uniref:hypothetical protein n=1 Tax=Pseudooceanicola sp. MF1-13 TaxID=3379095 RepID=UPI003892029F
MSDKTSGGGTPTPGSQTPGKRSKVVTLSDAFGPAVTNDKRYDPGPPSALDKTTAAARSILDAEADARREQRERLQAAREAKAKGE